MYKVHHIWNHSFAEQSSDTVGTNGVITLVSNVADHVYLPGTWYEYGMSMCKPGDNFDKKMGRQIATERLQDKREPFYGVFRYDGHKRYYDIKMNMLISILAKGESALPQWVYDSIVMTFNDEMFDSYLNAYEY